MDGLPRPYPLDRPYPIAVRLLHWLGVALVAVAVVSGIALDEFPKGLLREQVRALHYTSGCVLILLTLLRLFARLLAAARPPHPGGPAGLGERAALRVHQAMYLLMVLAPAVGLLDRWARGREVMLLGGIDFPAPFAVPGGKLWGEVHEFLAWALVGLVAAHTLAVLWHRFVLRDAVLSRMSLRG